MVVRLSKISLWLLLVAVISAITIVITIFSLTRGIHEVFPYLYLAPIILVSYAFPKRGVLYSLCLGLCFLVLVYVFNILDVTMLTISTAWFYVIVSVGVVMSSLSEGMKREERRYHGIFDTSQAGIFTIDVPSMRIVDINQQCARLLGYEIEGLIGQDIARIWPDDVERNRILSNLSGQYTISDAEVHLQNRQGRSLWVLISAAPVHDRKLVCSMVDITARRQIERALLDSEIKFRSLVEKSLAGVYIVQDDIYTYVNPRFAEIHGYTVAEIVGNLGPRDLVYPEDRPAVEENVRQRMDGATESIHFESRNRTKNGDVIYVEILGSKTLIRGKPGIMGTLLDITERKQATDALRRANEKLNLLDSVTRHDLLNQLTAFQGFTGLAEESSTDPGVTAYLGRARAVATKMQVLLKFTRDYQNMGMREPQWQSVREVFLQAAPPLETPDVVLSVDVGNLSIYADPLLEKVFANLMDNAFRHGGHVSRIHLFYEEHPDAIVLVFEDNGVGVPAIEKDMIFRRGYGKNTGYGLFLCREILALTGLSIREAGEPGKGARFEIAVPRVNYRLEAKQDGATSQDEVIGS